MSNDGIIKIHGKDYMTVAKRVELWHEDVKKHTDFSIETEVLQHDPVVVVKAVVKWDGKKFTGISSANPAKSIEKSNPYEVAETSAVGRALGFAGYGLIEGIASADEMYKAGADKPKGNLVCETCGKPATERSGVTKVGNKPYHGIFCSSEDKGHTKWINDLPTVSAGDHDGDEPYRNG